MPISYAVPWLPVPCSASSLALYVGQPLIPHLPQRLYTGCLYERQLAGTIPVLVTRSQPKRKDGGRYHAWWPQLAPSLALLHAPPDQIHGREAFAQAYRAELDTLPRHVWLGALFQLAAWLHNAPSVTFLSFERILLGTTEQRTPTQRQILRDWLLRQPVPPLRERMG